MATEPLVLDDDGMLDMEQFPDDGTELDAATETGVREALLSDPVDEPSDEAWADLYDDALAQAEGDGPFDADPLAPGADTVDPLHDDAGGSVALLHADGIDDAGEDGDLDADPPDDNDDIDGPVDLDDASGVDGGGVDLVGLDQDGGVGDEGLPDAEEGADVLDDPGDTLEDFH